MYVCGKLHTPESTYLEPNKGSMTCFTNSWLASSLLEEATMSSMSFHNRRSCMVNAVGLLERSDPFLGAFCMRITFPIYRDKNTTIISFNQDHNITSKNFTLMAKLLCFSLTKCIIGGSY